MRYAWNVAILLTALLCLVAGRLAQSGDMRLHAQKSKKVLVVAIVDTGLDLADPRFSNVVCKTGHKDFTGQGLADVHGHGTHVAGLIKQYAEGAPAGSYCLLILKYYTDAQSNKINLARSTEAFRWAVAHKAGIVNFSACGPVFDSTEYGIIAHAVHTLFVVAAGNYNRDISEPGEEIYPAAYPLDNVIPVGSLDLQGHKAPRSDFGPTVIYWQTGENQTSTMPGGRMASLSGTSMATAVHTGKIIKDILTH